MQHYDGNGSTFVPDTIRSNAVTALQPTPGMKSIQDQTDNVSMGLHGSEIKRINNNSF